MIQIRKAGLADAEQISHVHFSSWKSTYTELLNEGDLANITFENRKVLWETILKMPDKGQTALVAQDTNGQIIGFISGGKERTKRFGFDGEIYAIYLLEGFQRQGIGSLLLRTFTKEMVQAGYQSLLVWILTNNPSSRFYTKWGAQQIEKEEIIIGEGTYQESAFGWKDISELIRNLEKIER